MPTYLCYLAPGTCDSEQKREIARSITLRHSEATGAPPYFVQVMIEETRAERYLGGSPALKHIWIRGDIRAGRSVEQRTCMMRKMMQDVSRITSVPESDIWVYLSNLEPSDMLEYGHILPAPGEEQSWFEQLPAELQTYLESLGTTRENFKL